jgi:pimeloyl-ACP methyl ester carboxylesterase
MGGSLTLRGYHANDVAPTGIDVIWIHGLGEQSASFDAIVRHPKLARYAHQLVDLPGYGRAPWPVSIPPGDTLAASADRLAEWIDLRPSDDQNLPVLIGHSQGGVLAMMVAERTGVRAVINVEGNLTRGDCVFSGRAVTYSREDFAAHGFQAMRDDIYKDGLIERALRGYHAAMVMASPDMFWANARDLVAACDRGDLAHRFAALRCPTLFVAGVPHGICEASRHALAHVGAKWVAIEPSGHWPFIDRPDAFATEVAEFLAAL